MTGNKIFSDRHIGPSDAATNEMLKTIGVSSVDELIEKTIPRQIALKEDLDISEAMSESEYLSHMKELAGRNRVFDSYIGLGYYNTYTPSVILRNIFENPGWYTAYTPYQAEISQGRLEALLNFQTMVMELTGMEIANASLLDEGTAAAEAMIMFYNSRSRDAKKAEVNKLFISEKCLPQTIAIVRTRAIPLGIELVVGNHNEVSIDNSFFGAIVQYPDVDGEIHDYKAFTETCHKHEVMVGVAADILALVLLESPASWGADAVFGNTQRFGVPMGYGGPHAAYFATKEDFKRVIPGRIIGVSIDSNGDRALRMALQTREQHIRRDKATSNICTAQALLAVMASMYAVYHGPDGLKAIAQTVAAKTQMLKKYLGEFGFNVRTKNAFDTIVAELPSGISQETLRIVLESAEINVRYVDGNAIGISVDECATDEKLGALLSVIADACNLTQEIVVEYSYQPIALERKDAILEHEVFNAYHSETEMMRYLKSLENKDLSLVHSMIPLGSCTMKLNAASELIPLSWPGFAGLHPFAPINQTDGYQEMFETLDRDLSEITGFAKVSLQPNSGAQGEYAGLMVIRAYHEDRGEGHRNICLIPSSAHGTNPASAVMAGLDVVVVKCDDNGNINVDDLRAKAEKHSANLSSLMVTYPSTHGVYEEAIMEITDIIHQNGGQVYMDGANMNAQVGLTNPGNIGADVCHLNLHKTFAIPHGGGGPGMGPIGVAEHLTPFLPSNPVIEINGEKAIEAISAAPWGSALILLISYGYIKMLGAKGLKKSTEAAIVNANYIKAKVEGHYDVLYKGVNGTVAHEMIFDCRGFKKTAGIEVADIAKRLIDYGFHAPTVSFPVAGTLMVEPTESESKEELDRFCDALIAIRGEIAAIENGSASKESNLLLNAPHTAEVLLSDTYDLPYSREQAAYPLPYLKHAKYWSPVGRVDNAFGDRNLVCSCTPIEMYDEPIEI